VLPPLIVLWQHRNPLLGFFWIGVSYVFFVLIPYTLTCVANIFYHFRFHRTEINWLTNLVLPVAGIVINGYIFYKNFLKTYLLDATDFTTQTSIFWVGIVTLIILAIFTYIGISRTGGARQPHHFSETAMGAGD
jgi:amino acid transporter